jgi:hypothetical protein
LVFLNLLFYNNKIETWSQLVLDNTFDPTSTDAQVSRLRTEILFLINYVFKQNESFFLLGFLPCLQIFLQSFCNDFFKTDYADEIDGTYVCPMDAFNSWLLLNSNSSTPDDVYVSNCNGASSIPIPADSFNDCIIGWSQSVGDMQVFERNGIVEIIIFPFNSRVRFDSPYGVLDKEWKAIESWMKRSQQNAPDGVENMYFSSDDFGWYDTSGSMLSSAISSAGIALGASAIVVLFAMRSIQLAAFSLFTVAYILATVTALLVASGWTLGL